MIAVSLRAANKVVIQPHAEAFVKTNFNTSRIEYRKQVKYTTEIYSHTYDIASDVVMQSYKNKLYCDLDGDVLLRFFNASDNPFYLDKDDIIAYLEIAQIDKWNKIKVQVEKVKGEIL